ncbi:hypothetical protein NMG29_29640 [Streptomyces cocklensis]|uniref:DUF732 domain-containing protein n=1 Tax=Actinacidiphila cocklensis TaxID=887465 RepID=A0A9W4DSW2_9ACTN|nr:hypothetical protein [Actinacidiphila cocklensis]MDD1062337.1 hypothetical protein [Actinacidiphila cocklensis]WSX74219.1 hypothetical protein OH826_10270 [Streptomyces sp. NBC_00899]WSX79717.1 hypothetical protein OH826_41240 [Streptomyces sp. NBC_00899]CAG6395404.1 conserved hypothetical protein [Actinacidiphila cocklensis]
MTGPQGFAWGYPHLRPAAAAAVLVTAAAALLLGGCGSGGSGGDGDRAADRPSAPVSAAVSAPAGDPAATATAPPGDAPATTEAPGSAADAPKVPDAQLTPPGGGSFTKQQKTYLSGRVPRGTDPAAVLEGGQEICDRLTRTAKIDKDAAAGAIITGDISMSGAAAAVTALCPDQQPVIDAARRGFGDGTFTVAAKAVPGRSVAPGGYRAPNPSPSCTWRVTGANGATLASGGGARLTVPAAARGITSSGCYAWLASGGT